MDRAGPFLTGCITKESWSCPSSVAVLGRVGPISYLGSSVVLTLLQSGRSAGSGGGQVIRPKGMRVEELVLLLFCPVVTWLRERYPPSLDVVGQLTLMVRMKES